MSNPKDAYDDICYRLCIAVATGNHGRFGLVNPDGPKAAQEIQQLRAENASLKAAIRDLLDSVNARYPAKQPHEWDCPHMAKLDQLTHVKDKR